MLQRRMGSLDGGIDIFRARGLHGGNFPLGAVENEASDVDFLFRCFATRVVLTLDQRM
jgi:hypothetical protein